MEMPKPTDADRERFKGLVPDEPDVEVKPMFGNLGAFVNGNMFMGLFGAALFVRLPEQDHEAILEAGGAPFEPMPGRPMKGFAALPSAVLEDDDALGRWIDRALAHASSMPPKKGR